MSAEKRAYKIAGLGILPILIAIPYVSGETDINLVFESDDTINRVVDYCFAHATSENPIQELINAGLVSSKFSGYTCSMIQNEKNERALSKVGNDLLKDLINSK